VNVTRAGWHWQAQPGALPIYWARCSNLGQKVVFAPLRTVCNGENGPNSCLMFEHSVASGDRTEKPEHARNVQRPGEIGQFLATPWRCPAKAMEAGPEALPPAPATQAIPERNSGVELKHLGGADTLFSDKSLRTKQTFLECILARSVSEGWTYDQPSLTLRASIAVLSASSKPFLKLFLTR